MDIQRTPKPRRNPLILGAAGVVVLALATLGLSRLKPASPAADRASLWIDTVRRGPMVRQVRASGTLVPEEIRWISATTSGRIERIEVRPGSPVAAATVLMELSNPDVQLAALEAERALAASEADVSGLRSGLEGQRLTQVTSVASARSEFLDARRSATAAETLAVRGLISGMELDRARNRADESSTRYSGEQGRLKVQTQSLRAQLGMRESEVRRLRAIVDFHRARVASMRVPAGAPGVLQELPLELGQWVTPGMVLAKVAQPGRLKAVVRVAETQARDVAVGQRAEIDTHDGIARGRVSRVDPGVQQGTVAVEIRFDGPPPRGARPDLSVDATIELERLADVLYVGRPASAATEGPTTLFRVDAGGQGASRTAVRLGRGSVNSVEIVSGLKSGDRVILSDMASYETVDRVRLR